MIGTFEPNEGQVRARRLTLIQLLQAGPSRFGMRNWIDSPLPDVAARVLAGVPVLDDCGSTACIAGHGFVAIYQGEGVNRVTGKVCRSEFPDWPDRVAGRLGVDMDRIFYRHRWPTEMTEACSMLNDDENRVRAEWRTAVGALGAMLTDPLGGERVSTLDIVSHAVRLEATPDPVAAVAALRPR